MGIVRFFLPVLFLLAGTMAPEAAPVPVRSGEHATFTRLVFADPANRGWRVDRPETDRVTITLDGPPLDLDLRGVFDLVPKTRLGAIATQGRGLRLDLNCACKVDVRRLASGYVVIDILDEAVERIPEEVGAPEPDTGPVRRIGLPFHIPSTPVVLPRFASLLQDDSDLPPIAPAQSVFATSPSPSAPQVRILPARQPRLLPPPAPALPEPITVPACHLEATAREILSQDPVEALAGLPGLSAGLLDGEDRLDLTTTRTFALGYLSAGLGAEAMQVLGIAADLTPDLATIAAAFDSLPRPPGILLDPACGPATTLLGLLDTDQLEDWNRADQKALVGLMDSLPAARWRDVEPRLRSALGRLDADALLIGLHPSAAPLPITVSDAGDPRVAAGTDEGAIDAAIALLAQANDRGLPAREAHIVNAMALRRSIPAGDLKRTLDTELATALVIARHPADAIALMRDSAVPAASLLSTALATLPAAQAAEFSVRLRPFLADDAGSLGRIDDLLVGLGLDAPSARQGGGEGGPEADIVEVNGPRDAWLARDLPALATAPQNTWTGRNRLADAIVSRNGTPLPATDLARAGRVLDDSRALSGIVAGLLADPPS